MAWWATHRVAPTAFDFCGHGWARRWLALTSPLKLDSGAQKIVSTYCSKPGYLACDHSPICGSYHEARPACTVSPASSGDISPFMTNCVTRINSLSVLGSPREMMA